MTGRATKWFGRGGLVGFGFALAVVLLEAALQILHWSVDLRLEVRPIDPADPRVPIYAFGDSHTFGFQLIRALEALPVQVEQQLNSEIGNAGFVVHNFAFPGSNSAQVFREMELRCRTVRPAVAVVLVGFNDHWNPSDPGSALSRWQTPRLWRLLRSNRQHRALEREIEIVWEGERSFVKRADGSLEPIVGAESKEHLRDDAEQERVLRRNLEAIVTLCKELEIPLVLQTYLSEQNRPFVVASETVRAVARETGTRIADAARAVETRERLPQSSNLLQADGHPNALGARRMADTLVQVLRALPDYPLWQERAKAVNRTPSSAAFLRWQRLDPTSDSVVFSWELEGPPHSAFQVLISGQRASAEAPPWHPALGLAADSAFNVTVLTESLQGRLDAHGKGRAVLYLAIRELLGSGSLFAQGVLLEPPDRVLATTEVVELPHQP